MSSSESKIISTTQLSAFDCALAGLPLNYAFFFNNPVDPNQLQLALQKTCTHIPQISSVYQMDNSKIPRLVLRNQSPMNFNLDVATIDDAKKEDHIYSLGLPTNGIMDMKEEAEVLSYFTIIKTVPPPKLSLDTPVTACKLLILKSTGRALFCTSISHGVVDAHSYRMFITLVERYYAGETNITDFSHNVDRTRLVQATKAFHTREHDSDQLKKVGIYHPVDMKQFAAMAQPGNTHCVTAFNKKRLNEVKAEIIKATFTQLRISAHDILCAVFWKLRAIYGFNKDDAEKSLADVCPLMFVLDHRKFHGGKDYFGNAVNSVVQEKSRKFVLGASIGSLAIATRKTLMSMSMDDIQVMIDQSEKGWKDTGVYAITTRSYDFIHGCNFDDWRALALPTLAKGKDFIDLKFRADRFMMPAGPMIAPGMCFLKMDNSRTAAKGDLLVQYGINIKIIDKVNKALATSTKSGIENLGLMEDGMFGKLAKEFGLDSNCTGFF